MGRRALVGIVVVLVGGVAAWAMARPDIARLDVEVVDVAAPPIPLTENASVVWTGDEFIVWGGGRGAKVDNKVFDDGAAYDPATDRWRELAAAPLPPRERHTAVWTGDEMVVWGGTPRHFGVGELLDGARYKPATDTWRPMADAPAGTDRSFGQAVVVGGEVVIAAGYGPSGQEERKILRYDLADDSWRTATASAPVVQLLGLGEHVALLTFTVGSPTVVDDGPPTLRVERLDRSTGDIEPMAELELADAPFTAGLLEHAGDLRLLVEPSDEPTAIHRVSDDGQLERLEISGTAELPAPAAMYSLSELTPILADGSRKIIVDRMSSLHGIDLRSGKLARRDGLARTLCRQGATHAVTGKLLFVWGTGDCYPEEDHPEKPALIEVAWPEEGS